MESRYIIKDNSTFSRLETVVAELYLFFLPFRQLPQLNFLKSVVGASANWFPFMFHVLGLTLWLVNDGGVFDIEEEKRDIIRHSLLLMLYLNLSSLLMAVVIQINHGNQGSENAFQGILGMELYFFQYFLMFLYNYRVFTLLPLNRINRVLRICCRVLLIIGYVQVLVMNGIGVNTYDRLNFLGFLNSSSRLPKLCLTGSEGASAGCIIGVFVLPFLFSQVLSGKKGYIIEIALWLIPLYYTYSSTAYILFAAALLTSIAISILRSRNPGTGIIGLVLVSLVLALIVFALSRILDDSIVGQIRYLLLEKATDRENGSTASRTIPLLVNWGAFTEYPILGVGNGLQGYFYEKYFPAWAYHVQGSDAVLFLERNRQGISNGSLFFPSLLSGYGIIGCCLILVFIHKCILENSRIRHSSEQLYYTYIISGIGFIIMGFQGDVYGMYYAWFMLSIPLFRVISAPDDVSGVHSLAYGSRYIR